MINTSKQTTLFLKRLVIEYCYFYPTIAKVSAKVLQIILNKKAI